MTYTVDTTKRCQLENDLLSPCSYVFDILHGVGPIGDRITEKEPRMETKQAQELFRQYLNRRYSDRSTPKHYLVGAMHSYLNSEIVQNMV